MSENVYSRDKGGYRPPYGDRSGYSSRRDDRSSYGSRPSYGDRTRFETAKERREREEAEFLRRNEEAKSRPIKAEKAVGPQAVSVNLDKRMGILERNAHARMTEVYRAASEYLEKGDPLYLKQLKMVCEHFESDPYNSYAATAQNYIMANTHKIFGPNSEKEVKKGVIILSKHKLRPFDRLRDRRWGHRDRGTMLIYVKRTSSHLKLLRHVLTIICQNCVSLHHQYNVF